MPTPTHHEWPTALSCGCAVIFLETGPRVGDEVWCRRCGPVFVDHVERITATARKVTPSHTHPREPTDMAGAA